MPLTELKNVQESIKCKIMDKKQRHRVYKKMLDLYEESSDFNCILDWDLGNTSSFETDGFCIALRQVDWSGYDCSVDIQDYPELMENRKLNNKYFWDLNEHGYIQRVMLLLDAIEKTK